MTQIGKQNKIKPNRSCKAVFKNKRGKLHGTIACAQKLCPHTICIVCHKNPLAFLCLLHSGPEWPKWVFIMTYLKIEGKTSIHPGIYSLPFSFHIASLIQGFRDGFSYGWTACPPDKRWKWGGGSPAQPPLRPLGGCLLSSFTRAEGCRLVVNFCQTSELLFLLPGAQDCFFPNLLGLPGVCAWLHSAKPGVWRERQC